MDDRDEIAALAILGYLQMRIGLSGLYEAGFLHYRVHPAALDRLQAAGLVEQFGHEHVAHGRPWRLTEAGKARAWGLR